MSSHQARMKLKYREKYDSPIAGELGVYLGRGDGRISGAIEGTVVWDLYEPQGDTACSANLVGVIDDSDDDQAEFNTPGFFKREPGSDAWHLRSTVRFNNGTGELARFNDAIGTMTGVFDMATHTHDHIIDLGAVPED